MSISTDLCVLLILSSVCVAYLWKRTAFWIREGAKIVEPGYVSPPPRKIGRVLQFLFNRLMLHFNVGPVRLIGEGNLSYIGRVIALGPHLTERDALLSGWMMGTRDMRYFIAMSQVSRWRAPVIAWTGGIVVDHSEKMAMVAALKTAVTTMCDERDTSFVIYPQGQLYRGEEMKREQFHPGVVFIGRKVGEKCGDKTAYLPFGVAYDRNPSHATRFHRLMNHIGWHGFRSFFGDVIYGACICIGEPIPVECVPKDKDQAMDYLYERVAKLTRRAEETIQAG